MSHVVQNIVILLLFSSAIFYLAKFVFNQFNAKKSTCSSCAGGCSQIDFAKIEAELKISGKI